ncbi:MAG: mechanosensitive ion channel [Alphaproteobacteria bacterium]|nr:mechanosensitive ion channel [Alphaproteobacteria bacterium]
MNKDDIAAQGSAFFRLVMEYAPPVIGALLVLFAGWTIASWLFRFVSRSLEKTKVDVTLQPVIASVVRYIVLALTLMVVLQQFGVQTASLLALLGTIGLAIGLALQGTLSNVAAGLMLLFLRPFEVNNRVIVGEGLEGIVLGVDLFHTNLRTTEGVDIVIPNGVILSGAIRNLSNFPERVVRTEITVALESDPGQAAKAVREALEENNLLIAEREKIVSIRSLSAAGSLLAVHAWVKNEDFAAARNDLLASIRRKLLERDIKLG